MLRWTLEMAGREFGLDRKTVAGRVRQSGVLPGADGRFSTKDVASAIFGDLEFERTRKTSAEADLLESELAERNGDLVNAVEFSRQYLEPLLLDAVRIIESSGLPQSGKDEIRWKMVAGAEKIADEVIKSHENKKS